MKKGLSLIVIVLLAMSFFLNCEIIENEFIGKKYKVEEYPDYKFKAIQGLYLEVRHPKEIMDKQKAVVIFKLLKSKYQAGFVYMSVYGNYKKFEYQLYFDRNKNKYVFSEIDYRS